MANEALNPTRWLSQGTAQAMSPEAMRELMAQQMMLAEILAPAGNKERDIDRQQAYADMLRKTEGPSGIRGGRVFTAASPLEFLGAGIERYQGEADQKRLQGERTQMMKDLIDALRGKQSQGTSGGGGDTRSLDFQSDDPAMQRLIEQQQSAFYGDDY